MGIGQGLPSGRSNRRKDLVVRGRPDDIRFHLPQDFPLRLFHAISAETLDGVSNYL